MKAPAVAADCVPAIVRRVADAPEAPEREPPIGCHLAETALPWLADVAGPSVANGRAEELTLIVGHLQEPARPAPRIAADLGIGQVAHDCQRLLAGGRPVRQFNPFFVRQDSIAEVEME